MTDDFTLVETTVAEIHDAMCAGELSSEELVENYLDRIATYDRDAPNLNSVVTVNPHAKARAARLDEQFADSGLTGPLHGVPLLVKDQVSTADVVTTFGSEAFSEFTPAADATIVEQLKAAGAIILAKTNLPDWAAGFVGYSSVQGQTKNPYALDRDSGGSSAGTGAGVAANLGAVGVGEDTGGSIRVPASFCNLFGLRVTTGLISRTGLSPLVTRQDTAGPMARTVEDMALVLDALTGFDPADERTGATRHADHGRIYTEFLDEDGLEGARIGVLRDRFGDDGLSGAPPVTAVIDDALETMADAGAQIVDPVTIPALDERVSGSSLHGLQPKRDIDAFLATLTDPPAESVAELHERGHYHEDLELFETIAGEPDDPTEDPTYWERVAAQELLRETIVHTLAADDLDALLFPDVQVVPPRYEGYHDGTTTRADVPVNTVISSQSSCPSVSIPAGFTAEGLPVGVELLAAPYEEPRLIELAAGYEHHADPRRPPESTPEL